MTLSGRLRAPTAAGVARLVAVVVPIAVAIVLARPLVGAPVGTLAAVVGLVVVGVLLLRVEWAALAFVAVEPFDDYVQTVSASAVKGLGVVLVLAWLVRAAVPALGDRRPAATTPLPHRPRPGGGLGHPVALAGIAMIAVCLAATVVHSNGSVGAEVLTRYLSFLGALVVLVDCMSDRLPVRRVAAVYVASCALASVFGLLALVGGATRVAGPIGDPNDFAFFLVAALPLALVLRRTARRPILWDLAALLVAAAMLGTFSRGALLAVVAVFLYAVFTGVVRLRVFAAIVSATVVLVAVIAVSNPGLIENSLAQKEYVAAQNVDERLTRWRVTAEMTVDYPVLGIGPGGFKLNYDKYQGYTDADVLHQLDVAHETYLEVSAELGLLGLAAFLAVLGHGFAGAYRRSKLPDGLDWLAGGVCAALIGTSVAAIFLTEQYFLPLWLLAAFGAAMDPRYRGAARTAALMRDDDPTMSPLKGAR